MGVFRLIISKDPKRTDWAIPFTLQYFVSWKIETKKYDLYIFASNANLYTVILFIPYHAVHVWVIMLLDWQKDNYKLLLKIGIRNYNIFIYSGCVSSKKCTEIAAKKKVWIDYMCASYDLIGFMSYVRIKWNGKELIFV